LQDLVLCVPILFQVEEKEILLHQQMAEKEKLKQKYSDKMAVAKERNTFETQKRLKEQEIEFKVRL
jgi:hypothetical protein